MKAKLLSVAAVVVALAAPAQALASGGAGGAQAALQNATTAQAALGASVSSQNAVNANVPVSIAGGNVSAGPSSATQTATSNATTNVSNVADTSQDQNLNQNIGSSGCQAGCGGAGGFQAGIQNAQTQQTAVGIAKSGQNAVNANVPVSIAGGNVNSGSSSATQTANSNATTNVSNNAKTHQHQTQNQNIGGSSCQLGCGGAGAYQAGLQNASTKQVALGASKSDQNAVNANVPVSIAGGNVNSGSSSATQTANSNATTNVSNDAKTHQGQQQNQNLGGMSCGCGGGSRYEKPQGGCSAGCGGAGGFQAGVQSADTKQLAAGAALSNQNAVNGNAPVAIAGGNVSSGPSTASQTANSNATTNVSNDADTHQGQRLNQNIGGSSCLAGCGGNGGFQLGVQNADTEQAALGLSYSNQNAVNGNAPVAIAGGNVSSGPSTASQTANSNATTNVSNDAKTHQGQQQNQNLGGMSCGCGGGSRYEKPQGGCSAGCGGAGGFQAGVQSADTKQLAAGAALSNQNAVNGNAPVAIAGGNVSSGPSTASQTANSNATTNVSNDADTHQGQRLNQNIGGSSCLAGCGGNGGFQLGVQNADTEQAALGLSYSNQNAVNGNAPVAIAGGNVSSGPSTASQTANSNATTNVSNDAKTHQGQQLNQNLGDEASCSCEPRRSSKPKGCSVGCGGNGGFQLGGQFADTKQWAAGFAVSKQNAVNSNTPHSTAGGNVYDGSSNATQTAGSNGTSNVTNDARTHQNQSQNPTPLWEALEN